MRRCFLFLASRAAVSCASSRPSRDSAIGPIREALKSRTQTITAQTADGCFTMVSEDLLKHGDVELPELDAEDLAADIERYVDAVSALVENDNA